LLVSPSTQNPRNSRVFLVSSVNLRAAPWNGAGIPGSGGGIPRSRHAIPGDSAAIPWNGDAISGNGGKISGNGGVIPINLGIIPTNGRAIPINRAIIPGSRGAIPVGFAGKARRVELKLRGNTQPLMPDFIPTGDGPLHEFVLNFFTVATGSAAELGLTPEQVTTLTTLKTNWVASRADKLSKETAYASAVAAEGDDLALLIAHVRLVSALIQLHPSTTDAMRVALGITIAKKGHTPIAAPTTHPVLSVEIAGLHQHRIAFVDSDRTQSKARPKSAASCELRELVLPLAAPAPIDPEEMPFLAQDTRSPYLLEHAPQEVGKVAHYAGRWSSPTGQTGPWSAVVSLIIA